MAVIVPDTIYVLDEYETMDVVNVSGVDTERAIPWMLETNTQGANRAHDAAAYLQQVNVTFGNPRGAFEYGVRGADIHGRQLENVKRFVSPDDSALEERYMPFDISDFFLIGSTIIEWRFFARSIPDVRSAGQINLVQYRYTPQSVNSGYALGSVETFEYSRGSDTTFNGVPNPLIDTSRP